MNDNAFMVDENSNVILLGREMGKPRLVLEHNDGTYSCSCLFGQKVGRQKVFTKFGMREIRNPKICKHVRAVLRTYTGDWGDGVPSVGGADGIT